MIKTIKVLLLFFVTTCFVSCLGMDDFMQNNTNQVEYGNLELSFGSNTRSTTTTISPEEAKSFLVTVTQGEGEYQKIIRGPQILGSMNLRFPVGQDYRVSAESCTEEEAESSNNFWGQKRFVGASEPFGVNKGETTKVGVGMSVHNAAMCVIMHPSLYEYFTTSCTVTLSEGDRSLAWNYENAGRVEDDVTTDGKIAYFNTNESGIRTINYTIHAVSNDKIIDRSGAITLGRAKMSRLNLDYNAGSFSLSINVNQSDLYVDNGLTVGPDELQQDQGDSEIIGGNDDFNIDDTEVDYDQYN